VKRLTYSLSLAVALIILGSMLGLFLAACGSSDSSSSASPAATASAAPASGAAALLPESIKSSGVLRVGSSYTSPPLEYLPENSTTPEGLDIDLMEGIAAALGVKTAWTNMNWDGLRPALQTGRFDTVIASMGDFTDRQEQVTFVDYLTVGEGVLVAKANEAAVTTVEDLAGKPVGASKGTIAVTIVEQANKELASKGLEPIQLSTFSGDAPGMLALRSDRTFGHVMDLPFAVYEAKEMGGGDIYAVVLPNLMGAIPYGISVKKDNMALAEAIKAALDEMIADGSYQQILDKWGLGAAAVDEAVINGGTTSSGG